MPFLDKATEDFVLGQRSGFGKNMDKEYKNSSVKKRQRDLIRFLTAQGEEETKNNKIMDDRFEKSINSPAYVSAQNLNNFAGSGREVKYNLAGRGRVMADPNPNNPFRDIYEFARASPQAFETMVQGSLAQSPTKALGYVAEQFTGDSTTGNRFSEGILSGLTQQRDGKPGGRFGFRPEMTDEEKRVAGNDFYEQQRIDNEGRDMAKGILLEGGFTTDATYGDAFDTASWLIPGPGMAVKGLGVGVKASRLALAAAKASGRSVVRGAQSIGALGGAVDGIGAFPSIKQVRAAAAAQKAAQGSPEAVARMELSGLPNDPTKAAQYVITQLSDASKEKNASRLEIDQEDFYNRAGRDENNWSVAEKDEHDYFNNQLAEERTLHRDQFATNVEQAQLTMDNDRPIKEVLQQMGVDPKTPNAWMLKFIDADSIRSAENVEDYLQTFTHSLQELKEKAMNTLIEGQKRQIAKQKKNPKINIDELPYEKADDIPDEIIERLLKDYGEGVATGTRDKRTLKGVNALSIALDHIDPLVKGGVNSDTNFQYLLGILNSIKSGL